MAKKGTRKDTKSSKKPAKAAKKEVKSTKVKKAPPAKVKSTKKPAAPAKAPPTKSTKAPEAKKQGPAFGNGQAPKCGECKQPITHHLSTCPTVNATFREVERFTKSQLKAQEQAVVCKDFSNRVCIELGRRLPESGGGEHDMKVVEFLTLDAEGEGPFTVKTLPAREFDKKYKEIEGYPVARCATLFTEYMQYRGATERAVEELEKLINVNSSAKERAMAKKPSITTAKKTGKGNAAASMKSVKKGAGATAKAPKEKGERRSAASVAKELIMSGRFSDDVIFDKVSKEFPSFKRTYVAWYRNDLKKKGLKPPEKKAA